MNTPLNAAVQQILDALTSSGAETGLQVAVYIDGVQEDGNWDGFQTLVAQLSKESDVKSKSASAELDDMRR